MTSKTQELVKLNQNQAADWVIEESLNLSHQVNCYIDGLAVGDAKKLGEANFGPQFNSRLRYHRVKRLIDYIQRHKMEEDKGWNDGSWREYPPEAQQQPAAQYQPSPRRPPSPMPPAPGQQQPSLRPPPPMQSPGALPAQDDNTLTSQIFSFSERVIGSVLNRQQQMVMASPSRNNQLRRNNSFLGYEQAYSGVPVQSSYPSHPASPFQNPPTSPFNLPPAYGDPPHPASPFQNPPTNLSNLPPAFEAPPRPAQNFWNHSPGRYRLPPAYSTYARSNLSQVRDSNWQRDATEQRQAPSHQYPLRQSTAQPRGAAPNKRDATHLEKMIHKNDTNVDAMNLRGPSGGTPRRTDTPNVGNNRNAPPPLPPTTTQPCLGRRRHAAESRENSPFLENQTETPRQATNYSSNATQSGRPRFFFSNRKAPPARATEFERIGRREPFNILSAMETFYPGLQAQFGDEAARDAINDLVVLHRQYLLEQGRKNAANGGGNGVPFNPFSPAVLSALRALLNSPPPDFPPELRNFYFGQLHLSTSSAGTGIGPTQEKRGAHLGDPPSPALYMNQNEGASKKNIVSQLESRNASGDDGLADDNTGQEDEGRRPKRQRHDEIQRPTAFRPIPSTPRGDISGCFEPYPSSPSPTYDPTDNGSEEFEGHVYESQSSSQARPAGYDMELPRLVEGRPYIPSSVPLPRPPPLPDLDDSSDNDNERH